MKTRFILFLLLSLASLAVYAKDEIKLPETYNYIRGIEAIQSNNYREAHDYLTKEISDNPKNGYAYSWIATIDQYNEDYGQALANCDLALKYLPKKDRAYVSFAHKLRAEIYKELGEVEKASTEYDAAIKVSPEDVDLRNDRGNFYYLMEKYDLADLDYRKIVELEPSNPLGYLGLARNLIASKKYNEAIPQLDYAIKLSSNNGRPYAFRAEAYLSMSNWNKGTDDLISALSADSDDKAFRLMQDLSGESFDTFISKLKIQSVKEPNEAK